MKKIKYLGLFGAISCFIAVIFLSYISSSAKTLIFAEKALTSIADIYLPLVIENYSLPSPALTAAPKVTSTASQEPTYTNSPTQTKTHIFTATSTTTPTTSSTPTATSTSTSTSTPNETGTSTSTSTPTATSTPDYSWSTPIVISQYVGANGGAGVSRQAAVFDKLGDLHILYEEYHANNGADGNDDVFWVTNRRGLSWENPIPVSNVPPGQSSERPSLAIETNDQLQGVWQLTIWGSGQEGRYGNRPNGLNWTQPIAMETLLGDDVLENYQGGDGGQSPILLVDPNGIIDLIWRGWDTRDPTQNIFWSRQNGDGVLWSIPTNVSNHTSSLSGFELSPPAALVDPNDNIHLVWSSDDEFWYSTTPVSTSSWITPTTLPYGGRTIPFLANDASGNLHLLLQDTYGLLYASKPTGQTWRPAIIIVSGEFIGNTAGRSAIAVDQLNTIHVVWTSSGRIRYVYKPQNQGWSIPQTIFESSLLGSDVRDMSLLADVDGRLHLIWDQASPNNQVWYATTNPLYK